MRCWTIDEDPMHLASPHHLPRGHDGLMFASIQDFIESRSSSQSLAPSIRYLRAERDAKDLERSESIITRP